MPTRRPFSTDKTRAPKSSVPPSDNDNPVPSSSVMQNVAMHAGAHPARTTAKRSNVGPTRRSFGRK